MKNIRALLFGWLMAAPVAVLANLPAAPCTGLIGCGGGAANIPAMSLGFAGTVALDIAAASSVLLIVWSGFNMIIAQGDESKTSQFKWGVINALLGLSLAVSSSAIVTFVGTENYGQSGGNLPVSLFASAIRILVTFVNVSLVLIILLAGMRLFYAQGKTDEQGKAKKMIVWACIGAVIVNMANLLVRAVGVVFGL